MASAFPRRGFSRSRSRLPSAVLASLAIVLACVGGPVPAAVADPVDPQTPVLDTGVSLEDGLKVGAAVTVDQQAVHDRAQAALRALRIRMYNDPSLPFEGSLGHSETLKDYAAKAGYDSAEAYADAFTWSQELEMIAIQRAAENSITGMSHDRTAGSSTFTAAQRSGTTSNGEIITEYRDIDSAIDGAGPGSWSGEYDSLKANDGRYSGPEVAGHLHTLLDPGYTCYGFTSAGVSMGEAGLAQTCSSATDRPSASSGTYLVPVAIPADRAADVAYGSDSLDVGRSGRLTATVSYLNATDLPVIVDSYGSSDEKVVTVAPDGTMRAVGPGTATITMVSNGVTLTHRVTVDGASPVGTPSPTPSETSSPAPMPPPTLAPPAGGTSPAAPSASAPAAADTASATSAKGSTLSKPLARTVLKGGVTLLTTGLLIRGVTLGLARLRRP